ncbi:MAG: peptidyl-alpha-hydroxyglycine alpha-amidating lyase family protein [Vicinamibacterales bacterium]
MRLGRTALALALFTATGLLVAQGPGPAPGYQLLESWGPVPHDPVPLRNYIAWNKDVFWEMGRVAVNPKGDRLYAFRRSDPPILQIDPATGKILKEFGHGMFVWPHGMHIDKDNNLWVTDGSVANNEDVLAKKLKPALDAGYGHQVFKFSPEGKVLLTLGTKGVPGDDATHFNAPADVIVAPNGDIFVADGHVGTRVAKFDRNGKFLKSWGTKGTGPGQFSQPHGIAMDSKGRVFIGDRGAGGGIEIFDQEGNFIALWTQFGNPSGVAISTDDTIYVTDQGKRIVTVGSAKDGTVTGIIPDVWAEGVSVDEKHTLYAAEVYRRRLKKILFTPPGR